MDERLKSFYICRSCFEVYEKDGECHGRALIVCHPAELSGKQRQPLIDAERYLAERG